MEVPYSSLADKDCFTTSSSFAIRKLYELNILKLYMQARLFSCFLITYFSLAFLGILALSEALVLDRLLELVILLGGIGIGVEGILAPPREEFARSLFRQMVGFFAAYLSLLLLCPSLAWPDDAWTQLRLLLVSPFVLHFIATLALGLIGVSKFHRLYRCLHELKTLELPTFRKVFFTSSLDTS
jgi:hypothetical protein